MKPIMKLTIALSLLVLTLGAQNLLAAVTYVAGNCRPSLQSFTRIQDALNATPSPTTVLVCASPNPYPEQITISQPVNLQGISNGDQDRPVIAPPSGGLTQTATTSFGGTVYFQIFVNNVSGSVNISNLTVDGAGNGVGTEAGEVSAIFFQNSPGSVSRVNARNQAGSGQGVAILLEGGSTNPTVSVTNNSVRAFDDIGIYSETETSTTSEITTTISGNFVDSSLGLSGILINPGATATVSGNSVITGFQGIQAFGAGGSISGNTVVGNGVSSGTGIVAISDTMSVTGNKILKEFDGIDISSGVASVQGNTIIDSANVGIEFGCIPNSKVIHNTINDAPTAINDVPPLLIVPNTYFNVDTIRFQGGCF